MQTEQPYWLEEAYSDAIAASDIGMVARNVVLASRTKLLLRSVFGASARYLDYGAGYGLYVRLMRDAGFDFRWQDPFCQNVFARGFESDGSRTYDLVTAFEVFEHVHEPVETVRHLLTLAPSVLLTTALVPDRRPVPGDWWYYALDSGQHISLYSMDSLRHLARTFRLRLYSDGSGLHLFTPRVMPALLFRLVTHRLLSEFATAILPARSLTASDYKAITGGDLAESASVTCQR